MNTLAAVAHGRHIDYGYDAAGNCNGLPSISPRAPGRLDYGGFIAGACEYFTHEAKQSATIGTPYVGHEQPLVPLEFTATVRVTGGTRGAMYITASRAMLTIMLMRMGRTDITVAT